MLNRPAINGTSRYLVFLPVLLSTVVLWNRYSLPGLSFDAVTYLQIARNILLGKGLGWQAQWASPLQSVLIAATSYVAGIPDLLRAASFVAPAMALLLVIAVYKLAEHLFDIKTALMASVIAAISPHMLHISYSVEPEITYMAFLTVALGLFARSVTGNSLIYAVFSGVAFSLAYLARSEGFLIMLFVLAAVVVVQGRHFYKTQVALLCLVVTVVFFIVSAPYLYFLYNSYGSFVMSPKASYVICWLKQADLHIHDAENIDIWGLSSRGRLNWQEPRGISDLVSYLMTDPVKSLSSYLRNLSQEVPGRIPNNSGMEHYPQLFPIYLFLAAVASLFLNWGDFKKEKRAFLLSPLLILLVLPLFNGGWWKYLVPYFPIVVILAAKGVGGWAERLAPYFGSSRKLLVEGLICSAVVGAIAFSYYVALHPAKSRKEVTSEFNVGRVNYTDATKELGDAALRKFGPAKNYMAKWNKAIYYLNGFWTPFPLASYVELVRYARENKVDYIMLEAKNLQEMMTLKEPYPGLELVDIIESQNYTYMLAFFRLAN